MSDAIHYNSYNSYTLSFVLERSPCNVLANLLKDFF